MASEHLIRSIEVRPDPDRAHRFEATAQLDVSLAHLPGVCGGSTHDGPWVRERGDSPSEAFHAVLRRVGEVVCFAPAKKA